MRGGDSLPAIGTLEILVILIAIILFGPKRIPELARQIGSALAQLRSASDDFMRELTREPLGPGEGGKPSTGEFKKPGAPPKKGPEEGQPKPLTEKQIRDAAMKLGIKVKGKTNEELRSEMLERVYSGQGDPYGIEGKSGEGEKD